MTEHRDLPPVHWHGATAPGAAGSPVSVITPAQVDQVYQDTATNELWVSTGLTDTDWVKVASGGAGTVNEVNDGATTVANPAKIVIAETGTVSESPVGTARVAISPAVNYAGIFVQASLSTGDITAGKWGLYFRTGDSTAYKVWNHAGTLYAVEMTMVVGSL
jgi:hypothetical protein